MRQRFFPSPSKHQYTPLHQTLFRCCPTRLLLRAHRTNRSYNPYLNRSAPYPAKALSFPFPAERGSKSRPVGHHRHLPRSLLLPVGWDGCTGQACPDPGSSVFFVPLAAQTYTNTSRGGNVTLFNSCGSCIRRGVGCYLHNTHQIRCRNDSFFIQDQFTSSCQHGKRLSKPQSEFPCALSKLRGIFCCKLPKVSRKNSCGIIKSGHVLTSHDPMHDKAPE